MEILNQIKDQKNKNQISPCHWNLNSIFVNNFSKIMQLKAYNTIYKHDLICLSKTYLDSSTPLNDNSLETKGYNLVRVANPNDINTGEIYIIESLRVKVISKLYLECI